MLYVMRHFQSEMNAQDLFSGITQTPLSEKGYLDAQKIGKELSLVNFDYAICSPLSRTEQSLKEVLKYQKKDVPWEIDSRIIEFNFGDLEAVSMKTLLAKYPNFDKRYSRDFDAKAVNMESVDSVHNRVKDFLDDIKLRFKDKNLLVVSHNGAIRVMKSILLNYPKNMNLLKEGVDNGQVLKFDVLK